MKDLKARISGSVLHELGLAGISPDSIEAERATEILITFLGEEIRQVLTCRGGTALWENAKTNLTKPLWKAIEEAYEWREANVNLVGPNPALETSTVLVRYLANYGREQGLRLPWYVEKDIFK